MQNSPTQLQQSTATAPVMLPLQKIRLPRSLQTRVRLNAQTVAEYASAMKAGAVFPPIDIFYDGTFYFLGDGRHRCAAGKQCGCSEIAALVHPGGRAAALKFALSANCTHGLRRTNADKRRSVQLALKAFSEQSDRSIAEICRVSQTMVSALRNQLTNSVSSSPRVGLDGKERRVPVRPPNPAASLAANDQADLAGAPRLTPDCPAYMTMTPVFSLLAAAEELLENMDRSPGCESRQERVRALATELGEMAKIKKQVAAHLADRVD